VLRKDEEKNSNCKNKDETIILVNKAAESDGRFIVIPNVL